MKKHESFIKKPFSVIVFCLLLIYAISFLIPLAWGLMNTVKGYIDFTNHPFALPSTWHFDNFSIALKKFRAPIMTDEGIKNIYLPKLFINSFLYAGGCTIFSVISHACCSYISARYSHFFIGKAMYVLVIVCMLLPIVGALPSQIQIATTFHVYNNMVGVWLMNASFLGMNFLILYSTFKGLAWEYAEAGFIDGASHFKVFTSIMLPLVKTSLFAVGLIAFIAYWNDYLNPMIYIPALPTASYGLFLFNNSDNVDINGIPIKLCACFIVILPIFILFMIFNKKMMGNIAIGGIKG